MLRPSRLALLLVLTAAGAAASERARHDESFVPRGGGPVRVGRVPHGVSGTTTAACAVCHTEIAREVRGSFHAVSWRDEVFQRAYSIEPMAFCRHCHAPLDTTNVEPDGVSADEGVSCAVCHVRGGQVFGEGSGRGDARGADPHGVVARTEFAQSGYCAPCHQFDFPGDPGRGRALFDTREPMQDTFGEWSDSSAARAGETCQDCHMPWRVLPDGRRYRSHAFLGGHDPAMLRNAVRLAVRAERRGDRVHVEAVVSPGSVGHAFPTGDLFRRVELRVWTDDAPGSPHIESFTRSFATDIAHDGTFVRVPSGDTRIPPPGNGPAATIAFDLAAPRADRVHFALDHLLMPSPQAAAQGFEPARIRSNVLEGTVAVTHPNGEITP